MAKRTGPTNIYLRNLIVELKRFGNEKGINLRKVSICGRELPKI